MQTFTATHNSRFPAAIALRGAVNLPQSPQPAASGVRRTFDRGEEIFAEGEPCSIFYKVVSGTVRTGKLLADLSKAPAVILRARAETRTLLKLRFIVTRPGQHIDADELTAWCRERMANFKVPRHVQVIDAMPLNASGKVLKYELRERATAAITS